MASYGATSDVAKKWAAANSPWAWSSSAGPLSDGAMSAATTGGATLQAPSGLMSGITAGKSCGFGFWLKVSAIPASNSVLINIMNTSQGFNSGGLRINTSTGFLATTGTTTLTGTTNVCDNAWHWVEWVYAFGSSLISALWVDTVQQFNGAYTSGGSQPDTFVFQSITGVTVTIAHLFVCDTLGSALLVSSMPIGPSYFATLRPTGDSSVQFTPSTGVTNYSLINGATPQISNYVSSSTSGNQDTYTYGSLSYSPATVFGAILNSYLANPSYGTIQHNQLIKSSGSTTTGAATFTPPAGNPRVFQISVPTNPNGGGVWTASTINACTPGIKVT